MSNFRLHAPEAVLIHIPKAGGTTIRNGLWRKRYDGPVFGEVPPEWGGLFRFAFVRHPLDRLISAWTDCRQRRNYPGTLADFLAIVRDESVLFDGRRRTMPEVIRHHAIPQTHPFNCLHEADFAGRFERFEEDLRFVLERTGFGPAEIPRERGTDHGSWEDCLAGRLLEDAVAFYEEDFDRLGYRKPVPRGRVSFSAPEESVSRAS